MKIPGAPLLTIRDFEKRYAGKLIVTTPLLELGEGLYWIKGDNGSGKSTLFRALAGLIPFHGSVKFPDGIDIHSSPVEYRKRVSFSEAEPLYPEFLSGQDLITFVSKARKAPDQQITSLVDSFGMKDYIHQPCSTYSSGMLKKLSLVMAFFGDPAVIILDEPFITLDETARNTLAQVIAEQLRQHKTILVSSHQTSELNDLPLQQAYLVSEHRLLKV